MRTGYGTGSDRQLREDLEAQRRKQRELEEGDVIVEHPRQLLLRSPNGTFFALAVGDTGVLSAVNMGSTL